MSLKNIWGQRSNYNFVTSLYIVIFILKFSESEHSVTGDHLYKAYLTGHFGFRKILPHAPAQWTKSATPSCCTGRVRFDKVPVENMVINHGNSLLRL